VPPTIILAIWDARPPSAATSCRISAIRVLATQAYVGRRKTSSARILDGAEDAAGRHAKLAT